MYTALKRAPHVLAWERLGASIAQDVALGLNYLHTRKPALAHRDLKCVCHPALPHLSSGACVMLLQKAVRPYSLP